MVNFLSHIFFHYRPLLAYAAAWTSILTITVMVTSLSAEIAFTSALSPSSLFSDACEGTGLGASIRVPMDIPSEVVCLPAILFRSSKIDLLVPPLFSAMVVIGSAFFVRAIGLWEVDEDLTQ